MTRVTTLKHTNCIQNKELRLLAGWTRAAPDANLLICFGHRGTKIGGNKSTETVFVLYE